MGIVLVTICARGGSKGVPGKALAALLGKPLLVHTVEHALSLPEADRVIFSTDDERIAETARAAGAEAPFLRPAELARDDSPKLPVIRHAVEFVEKEGTEVDYILDLDVTSPLREIEDARATLALVTSGRCEVAFTVCPAHRSPYFNMVEEVEGEVRLVKKPKREVFARQAAPPVYDMNASIYAYTRERLFSGRGLYGHGAAIHVMPPERSWDIDTPLDLAFVEFLMKKRAEK